MGILLVLPALSALGMIMLLCYVFSEIKYHAKRKRRSAVVRRAKRIRKIRRKEQKSEQKKAGRVPLYFRVLHLRRKGP